MAGYDIIGDVHGHADKLIGLLAALGYVETEGAHRHPERTAVFVGDLIDRGPQQLETVRIVRAMVDAGTALITMGNHEFNAIAYATFDEQRGDACRPRQGKWGAKNREQHREFIDEVGLDSALHRDIIDWFRTIPLWLDLDGVRIVHACWHQPSIDLLAPLLAPLSNDVPARTSRLTHELTIAATTPGHDVFAAIEVVLKGPEVDLGGRSYLDKSGHRRTNARLRWWDPTATTLGDAALIPGGTTTADGDPFELPAEDADTDEPSPDPLAGLRYDDQIPVVFGHYWFDNQPHPTGPLTACVDYSAGNGGPLVAYRWSGEQSLSANNFVTFE